MSKLRKHFITVLAVLFCALLCISAALMIPNKSANAERITTADYWTIIGSSSNDLYKTTNPQRPIDESLLKELYRALTGADTLDGVKTALNSSGNTDINNKKYLTSNDFRTQQGGTKNVSVWLGGKKWDATYLTVSDSGDVVLDLWLSADYDLSTPTNIWANSESDTPGDAYPSNMYSTSVMRVETLNAGGYVSDSNRQINFTATGAKKGQSAGNEFARFTMDNVANSLTKFIVKPANMAYQSNEYSQRGFSGSGSDTLTPFNLLNDAYGTPAAGSFNTNFDYTQKGNAEYPETLYGAWKDDYIWLPSKAEVGGDTGDTAAPNGTYGANDISGIWKADGNMRASRINDTTVLTWLRSGDYRNAKGIVFLAPNGGSSHTYAYSYALFVRPAFHFNLSVADEDSKKVFFDDDGFSGNDGNGYVHTYSGQAFEKEIRDYDRLDRQSNSSDSTYVATTGKFSATEPDIAADKTYELVVKPKTGYYWADWETRTDLSGSGDEDDKKYGERTYKITIQLAEIDVNWGNLTVTSGGSLLQDSVPTVKGGQTIVQKLYKIDPDVTDKTLPQNPQWVERSGDTESQFTATQSGTYYVYYIIEAKFHKPTEVACYEVTVSSDSIKITVNGDLSIGSGTYSENNLDKLNTDAGQNLLKNQVRSKVTLTRTSNNLPITGNELDTLWNNLEIYPFTYNANNAKVNSSANDNGYYDVGTYLLGVRYKSTVPTTDQTYSFTWNMDGGKEIHPTFTVDKKEIWVKVVAKADGGSLTHVYGESHVEMTYALVNASDLSDGEDIDDLKLWDNFTRKDNGEELAKRTPAGTYNIIGAALDSNYAVKFADSEYVITKRAVKLQVADETVGYGTSFDGFTYKPMTEVENNVVTGDDLQALTADAPRSLKQGAVDFDFSSSLVIGDYDLYVGVETDGSYIYETDNYIFEILPGKLKITKGSYNMSGVRLDNKGYVYDGQPHPANIENVPSGVTVSFRYVNRDTGEELDSAPTEVGLYLVYASFSHDNLNYNPITTVKAAYIRIAYTEEEANADFPALPTDEELAAAADLAKKKADAKEELEKEAQAKKDEIDADLNLTPEEKAAAKSEVDKELADGKSEIDKAKDKDGVDSALSDGKKEIDDTADLAKKKGAAKSELDKAAQAKKDAIDNDPNLTDEEKAAAKAEVDKELADGKDAIDKATDKNSVETAESSTKANIENIKPEHKGDFPWWILAVIAGALVLVTVLIIVIVKRRNSEDDDGGYDDFYDDEYDYDEEEEVDDDGDEAFGY